MLNMNFWQLRQIMESHTPVWLVFALVACTLLGVLVIYLGVRK